MTAKSVDPPGSPEKKTSSTWHMGEQRVAEKRENVRVRHGEAARMYNVDKIGARIETEQQSYEGNLLDLSAGGIAMLAQVALPLNLPVQVDVRVGDHTIRAHGLIKNRSKVGGQYRLGVQFTSLDPEEEAFLHLLYGPGGTFEEVDGLAGE